MYFQIVGPVVTAVNSLHFLYALDELWRSDVRQKNSLFSIILFWMTSSQNFVYASLYLMGVSSDGSGLVKNQVYSL